MSYIIVLCFSDSCLMIVYITVYGFGWFIMSFVSFYLVLHGLVISTSFHMFSGWFLKNFISLCMVLYGFNDLCIIL